MAKKRVAKRASNEPKGKSGVVLGVRLRSPSKRPIQVEHLNAPLRYARRERIHARRVLPRVQEGREREFHSLTSPLSAHLQSVSFLGSPSAADDLAIVTNTELTGPGQKQLASSVGEPSVSTAGQVVMYAGNWYAARSADGGQTFQYISPFTSFPDPPNLVYCCDQVVNYIPSIDTFVWLLQYGPATGPQADNVQRLAFAKSADAIAGKWTLFDITTASLGVSGQFLDFPDLAVGNNCLYVTTNLFNSSGQSTGAALIRIPIASISSGSVTIDHYIDQNLNSFRVAQNCGSVAYFAAHQDTSTLKVFSWEETKNTPVSKDVAVARWIGGQGYQSRTPDGQRWLDRIDPRITGATLITTPPGPELWFAWSVDANSNHRPNPFVQIARIDAQNLTLLDNINVFDQYSATAYGALSTNSDNEVGISYMIGGGTRYPSHMVAILTGTRKDLLASAGTRGTADGQWGDFLTVRPVMTNGAPSPLFAATGYTMLGPGDGSNRDAIPRYVVFGRSSGSASGMAAPLASGTAAPQPPMTAKPLPATPVADGNPITDVNSLSIVSQAVAARIKVACGLGAPSEASPEAAFAPQPEADKPGTERWPVKTGQDPDRAKVGKNVVNGQDLKPGIVQATVEELISLPRPPGLTVATSDPPQFQNVRDGQTEVTIWQIEAVIIALKHEADGDYHLVLQGASGATMVGEIPTPTKVFVGDSPWLTNIGQARQQIDQKLVRHLTPAAFAVMNGKYMPHAAMTYAPQQTADPALRFDTPGENSNAVQPLFATKISPTSIRITGVGFFDRAHGQTGAAPNVIELHPVLKVEWT